LKRLRDLFIIEKFQNFYRVNENEKLEHIFEEKIKKYYVNDIMDRVHEYFKVIGPK